MPSTVISSFSYNATDSTLTIVFVTGKSYLYKDVSEEVYQQFKAAFAKGIFFNEQIKDKYVCEKLR